MLKNEIIVKLDQSVEQTVGNTKKIVGLMKAKWIIPIITNLNLDANPRSSQTGDVTDAIQESIAITPKLFPFKTKGILLGATQYDELERKRYRIIPQNPTLEGILDGGHNTLAIGLYILEKALKHQGKELPKGSKKWEDFKKLWAKNEEALKEYTVYAQNENIDDLDFFIPVEIVLPINPNSEESVEEFRMDLFDICEARNNNVQLNIASKANQKGHFETLKRLVEKEDPSLCKRIEWKTNDGGEIKVQDLIALAWIPLSMIKPVRDEMGKEIEPPAPNKLYSGKGSCMKTFEKLMSSKDVFMDVRGDYKESEIKNSEVISALEITAQLPKLYDYIYENLPRCYNENNGSYGRILAVKKLDKRRNKRTPFLEKGIEQMSPDGFIMPIVYGLSALLEKEFDNQDNPCIKWKCDPMEFLKENLTKIVSKYKPIIEFCQWDPQKVGKASGSYDQMVDAYKMAENGLL